MITYDPNATALQLITDNFSLPSAHIVEFLLYAPLLALSFYACNPRYARIVFNRMVHFQRVWLIGNLTQLYRLFIIDSWNDLREQSAGGLLGNLFDLVLALIIVGGAWVVTIGYVIGVAILVLMAWPFLHYTAEAIGMPFWEWLRDVGRRIWTIQFWLGFIV